jgi:hypothetical protein
MVIAVTWAFPGTERGACAKIATRDSSIGGVISQKLLTTGSPCRDTACLSSTGH